MTLRRAPAAFTLIELMIVLAVIALMAAAAVPAMGGITGANARQGAGELAGTMRWLFESASVRHATCRLAIEPGERSFWAECAKGRTPIDDPAKAADRAGRAPADGDAALAGKDVAGFSAFEDPIVKKRELPGNASFRAVRVEGRDALAEGASTGYVHFFPGGRAQGATVTIEDGGHVYTVRLEPFTGRARVSAGAPSERER